MKGIVAEVNGRHMIVLTQDGIFKKVKAMSGLSVGSEVDLGHLQGNVHSRFSAVASKTAAIAAAALFTIGLSYGAYCYASPYSYVSVDINPSIEITANVFNRIIKVEALNEDAKKLLSKHRLNYCSLDDGVSQLLKLAVQKGYLKPEPETDTDASAAPGSTSVPVDTVSTNSAIQSGNTADQTGTGSSQNAGLKDLPENAVMFTVSSTDGRRAVKLKSELKNAVSEELTKEHIRSEVLAGQASLQQLEAAKKLGMTPGKLALIQDELEDKPLLKVEELKKEAVKGLIKKAREKRDAMGKARPETGTAKSAKNIKGPDDSSKSVGKKLEDELLGQLQFGLQHYISGSRKVDAAGEGHVKTAQPHNVSGQGRQNGAKTQDASNKKVTNTLPAQAQKGTQKKSDHLSREALNDQNPLKQRTQQEGSQVEQKSQHVTQAAINEQDTQKKQEAEKKQEAQKNQNIKKQDPQQDQSSRNQTTVENQGSQDPKASGRQQNGSDQQSEQEKRSLLDSIEKKLKK